VVVVVVVVIGVLVVSVLWGLELLAIANLL
jgi:hypothetical protein